MADATVVRSVLSKKNDYYALLGVQRAASPDEIKKAYLKLALKLHPDKNPAPGAEEAFKTVKTAYDTLQDDKKRRAYDNYGTQGVQAMESGASPDGRPQPQFRQARGYYRNDADVFEDFILNAFGGGMHRRRPQQGQGQEGQPGVHVFQGNIGSLMMIPIIVFFLFAVLLQSNVFDVGGGSTANGREAHGRRAHSTEGLYSLEPNQRTGLMFERHTNMYEFPDLRVPYYVGRNFDMYVQQRRIDLRRIELEALQEHKHYLERRCHSDLLRSQKKRDKGRPPICNEFDRFASVP